MAGYVKLHRSAMYPGSTFEALSPVQRIIAIYLIMNANHKDGHWADHRTGKRVEVKRGQLIVSRSRIIEWFGNSKEVTSRKVRTCLERLEKDGFLTKKTTNAYTLITLHNYGLFQGSDEDSDQHIDQNPTSTRPAPDQRNDPKQEGIKNVKNVKKVKEKKQYAEFVRLQESEFEKLTSEHGEPATRDMIAMLDNYKGANKKQYADDYRAILQWVVDRYYEKPRRNEQHGRRTEGAAATDRTIAQGQTGWINRPKHV